MIRAALSLAAMLVSTLVSAEAPLSVRNPTDVVRTDWPVVLTIDQLAERGIKPASGETVLVTFHDHAIASQLDDLDGDGRPDELVFVSDCAPHEVREFTLAVIALEALPSFKKRAHAEITRRRGGRWVDGMYRGGEWLPVKREVQPPEHGWNDGFYRFDGPGWESDKIAWRTYMDDRNAIDIFGKRIPEMVLSKTGLTGAESYHDLQPWGTDALKVADSLGVGALGALRTIGGQPSVQRVDVVSERVAEVVADGPVRAILRMTYKDWQTHQGTMDVVQDLIVYAGQHWFESRVTVSGIDKNVTLISGIVRHVSDVIRAPERKIVWLGTHGPQEIHGDQLGMAVLWPRAEMAGVTGSTTDTCYFPMRFAPGRPASYYAMAAWEREDPRWAKQAEFVKLVDHVAACLAEPLQVLPPEGKSDTERMQGALEHGD